VPRYATVPGQAVPPKLNPKQAEQNRKLFERRARRLREQREADLRQRLKDDIFRNRAQPRDAATPLPLAIAAAYQRLLTNAGQARDRKIGQLVAQWLETSPEFGMLYAQVRARFLGHSDDPRPALPVSSGAVVPAPTRAVPRLRLNVPLPVPSPFPRPRFGIFEDFQFSDVGARAITNIVATYETTKPWGVVGSRSGRSALPPTVEVSREYRTHPSRRDLTSDMEELRTGRAPITLSFPSGSGEVMYVITEDYRLVIAARSGHQRDLPHPTLIGGIDPRALSAGLVEFANNRIKKVKINASGHFRPNSLSSVEVSMALFGRLPPNVFHPNFDGYFIYGGPSVHPPPQPRHDPAPFNVVEGPDTRGTVEQTRALSTAESIAKFNVLTTAPSSRELDRSVARLRQRLKQEIVAGNTDVETFLLPSVQMRRLYSGILNSVRLIKQTLAFGPEIKSVICDPLGPDPDFRAVASHLISRMF